MHAILSVQSDYVCVPHNCGMAYLKVIILGLYGNWQETTLSGSLVMIIIATYSS